MAAAGRAPRTMVVIPSVAGLSDFQSDLKKISTAAKASAKSVDDSFKKIGKSVSGTGTGSGTKSGLAKTFDMSKVTKSFAAATKTITSGISKITSGALNAGNSIRKFGNSIEGVGRGLRSLGRDAEMLGRGLTVGITLPVIGSAIAIGKWGGEFETALVRVQTLVGVSASTVKSWGDTILKIAPELATLPVDMAEGLFFAASAFGDLAEQAPVMDVLIASTKGSALGLGDVGEVARVTTALMKSFGEENYTASRTVELLVKATQQGNFELDTLVTTLGRVLGSARAMNAGMDDVLAWVSTLTLGGLTTAQAVTSLNTALLNLIKPSGKAADLLQEFGFTVDVLKEKLGRDSGLQKTLFELYETLGEKNFLQIFSKRALQGVLPLVEGLASDYERVAESMVDTSVESFGKMGQAGIVGANEVGSAWREASTEIESTIDSLDDLFAEVVNTVPAKMTAVQGSIQSLGITIYQVFHEDIKSALDSIFSLTQRMIEFSQANTETVKLLAKIALAAAAVGPALLVLSKVFQLFSFTFQIIGRGIAVFGGLINIILKTIGALGRLAGIIFNVVGKALLLLGQLIFAVSKQMFIFAFKATAALAKSIFTLLVPAFAALNRLLLRLAFQAILAVAAVGKLTLSFVVLATQSAILHIGKVSAWIIEVGIAAIGTVAALAPMVAAFLAIGAAIGVVIVAAFALVGAFRQLAGKVAEALGRVSETIAGFFGGIKKDGESWGEGLSKAYAEGIVEGAVYIIEALSAIGNAIAYWLQTFSPPKLLPDLTKWGTGAMQAYMDGWLKADFSVLFEIGDTIQSHLEAMSEDIKDSATKISIAEAVLGSRESIAEAIAQIKLTGTITEDMFQKIFESIGMVTPQLDGYIRATLNMVVANKRLAVAQEEVNRVNQKYADLLAPISGRLKEIENIRQDIADTARLDELESVLADTNISDRVRELAALEIEEITLQGQQRDIETERDSAVAIAGQQLDEAKAQAAIATAQLEHAQGLIDLAQSQTDILRDMLDESKSSADSLKEISKKLGDALSGGGGGIDTSPLDPESWLNGGDPGDLGGGLIDKKIEALKESLGGLKDSWVGVWDEITRIAGDKFNTIKGKWKALVWTMNHKWGNLINSVKEAGTEIWDSLKETWEDIWGETDNFTAFNVQMGLLMDYLQDDAPGAIENFADTVANSWIPAIGSIIKSLLDPEGLLHAIAKVFLSVSLFIIQPIVATLLLEEALDDLSGAIGRLGYKVGTYLRGKVKDAIDSFGEWHDGIRDSHPIYDTFLKVLGNVWTIFKKLWIIQLLLLGILTAVAEYIFTAVITAFEGILLALGTLHDYIRDYVNKILVELFGKTEDVADETSDWGDFVDTLHGYWITFVDWIQNTLLGVLNDINEALGNASGWLDGMIEKLKEFLVKVQQGKDAIKSVNPFSEDPEDPEDPGKIPETAGVQSAATPVAAGIQSLFGGVTSAFSPSVPGTTGTTGSPGRTARYGIGSRRTSPVPSVISAGANSIIAAGGGLVLNMGPITINDDMDMALFEARVRQVVVSSME